MGTPTLAPAPAAHPHWHAPALMAGASLLFACMAVCVKLASARYSTAEIVAYRGLIGLVVMTLVARWHGGSLRTKVPGMHLGRSAAGVGALLLWFYAMGRLPLATAVTLNYMSSVWIAVFLIGGAVLMRQRTLDWRLVATVLTGFVGVALVLQPTEAGDVGAALAGAASGMLAALAYLQLAVLGRSGEPEYRVVFYFSLGGTVAGLAWALAVGFTPHTLLGLLQVVAVGVLATVAQMMITRAYAIGHSLANASLQYTGLVFASVIGVVAFDEVLPAGAWLGMVLIVGAGLVATLLRQRAVPELPADSD